VEVCRRQGDEEGAARHRGHVARIAADFPWPDAYLNQISPFEMGSPALMRRADILLKQKRFSDAESVLARAAQLYPESARIRGGLGLALFGKGKTDRATAEFRQAIALNPELAEMHYYLGLSLAARSEFSQSIESFRQTIRLRPGYAEAHLELGKSMVRLRRLAEAEQAFRRAIECDRDLAGAYKALGILLAEGRHFNEAEGVLAKAIALEPLDRMASELLRDIRRRAAKRR